jgi:hypothetical protein
MSRTQDKDPELALKLLKSRKNSLSSSPRPKEDADRLHRAARRAKSKDVGFRPLANWIISGCPGLNFVRDLSLFTSVKGIGGLFSTPTVEIIPIFIGDFEYSGKPEYLTLGEFLTRVSSLGSFPILTRGLNRRVSPPPTIVSQAASRADYNGRLRQLTDEYRCTPRVINEVGQEVYDNEEYFLRLDAVNAERRLRGLPETQEAPSIIKN